LKGNSALKNNFVNSFKVFIYAFGLIATALGGYFTAITTLKVKIEEHERRLLTIETSITQELNQISKEIGELKITITRLEERIKVLQENLNKKR